MVFTAHAQPFQPHLDATANPPNFIGMSYNDGRHAVDYEVDSILVTKTKKINGQYIADLVHQLRDVRLSNDKKVFVIYLLGELSPPGASSIEALIEYIDLKATKLEPKGRISVQLWGEYPAEEALIKMGLPTVNPILNHLAIEKDTLRRHLMCEVLIRVEGKKGLNFNAAEGKHVAEDQIKEKLAQESNPERRANLQAVIQELTRK